MMRFTFHILLSSILIFGAKVSADTEVKPLPIDSLWESEGFLKALTASYGIDSRIEPRITVDEEHYLGEAGKAMAEKDREKAITTLTESSLLEESPAMLSMLASLQFEDGKLEEAIETFQKALEQFPNFRDVHRNLAIALIRQEKIEEAQTHLIRAMELGSHDGLTMGLLGYCHAVKEHPQASLNAYQLARLSQPNQREWIMGEAQALLSLEKPAEASAVLQELIDANPSEMTPWLIQSDAWVAMEKPLRAISNLEVWRRTGELSPSIVLSLGHLYLQNDLPDLALSRYREAILGAVPLPDAVEAITYLTNRQHWPEAKEVSEAIDVSSVYKEQLESGSLGTEVESSLVRNRALIELETGNAGKGAEMIEAWLEREPLDGQALILLARFKSEGGQREVAEMLLEQAERLPDHAAAAHLAHGKLLVANAEYADAIAHLEKANRLDPSDSVRRYLDAVRELAD
ncbi:MAG: hypothetical protein CMO55_02780 [Verrucomicrobiales bacterium]|nr:hypothetical protein [Verrucomicrobiales bacterium]